MAAGYGPVAGRGPVAGPGAAGRGAGQWPGAGRWLGGDRSRGVRGAGGARGALVPGWRAVRGAALWALWTLGGGCVAGARGGGGRRRVIRVGNETWLRWDGRVLWWPVRGAGRRPVGTGRPSSPVGHCSPGGPSPGPGRRRGGVTGERRLGLVARKRRPGRVAGERWARGVREGGAGRVAGERGLCRARVAGRRAERLGGGRGVGPGWARGVVGAEAWAGRGAGRRRGRRFRRGGGGVGPRGAGGAGAVGSRGAGGIGRVGVRGQRGSRDRRGGGSRGLGCPPRSSPPFRPGAGSGKGKQNRRPRLNRVHTGSVGGGPLAQDPLGKTRCDGVTGKAAGAAACCRGRAPSSQAVSWLVRHARASRATPRQFTGGSERSTSSAAGCARPISDSTEMTVRLARTG